MSLKIALTCGGVATAIGGGCSAYYLLQKTNTIRDELISKNLILIESNDDYEIAFRESKDTPEFITLINSINKEGEKAISKSDTLALGGQALKKWCETNLNLSATKENIDKVLEKTKENCVKTLFTIKDKMKKNKKKLIENLTTKFTELKVPKKDEELQKDLESINPIIKDISSTADDVGKAALTTWCNNSLKEDLTKDKEDKLWKKVDSRCLEVNRD